MSLEPNERRSFAKFLKSLSSAIDRLNASRQTRRVEWVYQTILALFAFALIIYPAMFLVIWTKKLDVDVNLQAERIRLEEKQIDLATALLSRFSSQKTESADQSTAQPSQPDSSQILERFVENQRAPTAAAPVQALLGLLDGLVKAGAVTASEADDLRKEIQKATLDGAKEITVETAKGLIDRFIKPHDEKSPPATPAGTTINNYCWMPSTGAVHMTSLPAPTRNPKPVLNCGKG